MGGALGIGTSTGALKKMFSTLKVKDKRAKAGKPSPRTARLPLPRLQGAGRSIRLKAGLDRGSTRPEELLKRTIGLRVLVHEGKEERLLQGARVKTVRSAPAFVRHAPVLINKVNAVRERAVGLRRGVVHRIDEDGEVDLQPPAHLPGGGGSLQGAASGGHADLMPRAGLEAPMVAGVSLADVDEKEIGAVRVAPVDRPQGPELGPEGPSREAPEDEHHGPFPLRARERAREPVREQAREPERLALPQGPQLEIWSRRSDRWTLPE